MDKGEILEKSRQENRKQDEMEKQITIEGDSFSLAITLAVGILLYSYNRLHNLSSDTIFIMFWTSFVSSRLYRLTKRKKVADLINMIVSLVILIFYVVRYFTQG